MKEIIISCDDVDKVFVTEGVEYSIIENMNLEIYKGEFTVIMGASGSGKSTLLYLLSGMDSVTRGRVMFENRDLNEMSKTKTAVFRRDKVGFVFQGINLLGHLSLLENILVVGYLKKNNKKLVLDRAKELFQSVGLEKEMNKKPSQVSGGQAQRAAIVRALINESEMIFADEPTGSLNSKSSKEILDILSQLNEKGQSITMVTHDAKAALRAERLLYMSDGKIIGDLYDRVTDELNTSDAYIYSNSTYQSMELAQYHWEQVEGASVIVFPYHHYSGIVYIGEKKITSNIAISVYEEYVNQDKYAVIEGVNEPQKGEIWLTTGFAYANEINKATTAVLSGVNFSIIIVNLILWAILLIVLFNVILLNIIRQKKVFGTLSVVGFSPIQKRTILITPVFFASMIGILIGALLINTIGIDIMNMVYYSIGVSECPYSLTIKDYLLLSAVYLTFVVLASNIPASKVDSISPRDLLLED